MYSGNLVDFKSITNLSNTEAIKNIRQKINSYGTQNFTTKKMFIENVPFYIRTVGFQETVENILPIISDLSREKDLLVTTRFFEIFEQFIDEIKKFGDKGYFILKEYIVKCLLVIEKKNLNKIQKTVEVE